MQAIKKEIQYNLHNIDIHTQRQKNIVITVIVISIMTMSALLIRQV